MHRYDHNKEEFDGFCNGDIKHTAPANCVWHELWPSRIKSLERP